MLIKVNIRDLGEQSLRLEGKITAQELELETNDELVQPAGPVSYELEVELLDNSLLVQGGFSLPLDCGCARCLKRFEQAAAVADWAVQLPLDGEDAVPVVNDCVDLTPYVRDDILLAFPQHPLCEPECRGLKWPPSGDAPDPGHESLGTSSVWAELNKLKL